MLYSFHQSTRNISLSIVNTIEIWEFFCKFWKKQKLEFHILCWLYLRCFYTLTREVKPIYHRQKRRAFEKMWYLKTKIERWGQRLLSATRPYTVWVCGVSQPSERYCQYKKFPTSQSRPTLASRLLIKLPSVQYHTNAASTFSDSFRAIFDFGLNTPSHARSGSFPV